MFEIDLSDSQKIEFITQLASFMKIDPEPLFAVYVLMGDDFFCLLTLLEKHSIRFPALSTVRKYMEETKSDSFMLHLKAKNYRVGTRWVTSKELKSGMFLQADVLEKHKGVIGHYFSCLLGTEVY